jgi:hypothetical protein
MVGSTRSTPNGFDASGNGDLPPPPPMTPVETFMATQTNFGFFYDFLSFQN